MLPLFSAPFDAHGTVLVPGRPGPAEPADTHAQSPPDPGSSETAAVDTGDRDVELAQWTAFARGLGLAHDSVYDVIRAVGLDASLAHAVAEQVTSLGQTAKEVPTGRQPVDPAAKLALVFEGVTVTFASGSNSFKLSVDAVSVKASTGADGQGQAGFGEARFRLRQEGNGSAVDATDQTLETRVQELGVSVAGEVTVGQLPTGEVAGDSVSQLRFDLAVPLASASAQSLEPGTRPVNVTV